MGVKKICKLCPHRCNFNILSARGLCHLIGPNQLLMDNKIFIRRSNIELTGFFHFFPGHECLEISLPSCNLRCTFCEKERKSYSITSLTDLSKIPEKENRKMIIVLDCSFSILPPPLINKIIELKHRYPCIYISHITNGFIEKERFIKLMRNFDALLVRFFGFSDLAYSRVSIAPRAWRYAAEITKTALENNIFLELSYTIIPGYNEEDYALFLRWLVSLKAFKIPLHIKRFYPRYLLKDKAPTRTKLLMEAFNKAKRMGFHYVYIDDIYEGKARNTYCPNDGSLLIRRVGYFVDALGITDSHCKKCGEKIPIKGEISSHNLKALFKVPGEKIEGWRG